ncbi:MAG: CvpA family protein, partial [Planctomycetes bacterium]|nr:CvpA family protein [Planctomycetota bacterium]
WQVSRIGILLVAYGLAGRFGGQVGAWLGRAPADAAAADTGNGPLEGDSALYLAYVLVFVGVVVALSLLAIPLQRLVKKSGLGFFDRVFGGVFGVATGACTVLFLLFLVNMFGRETAIGQDARASHSQRLSREAIDWLGPRVPDELRGALYLTPLRAGTPAPAPDSPAATNGAGLPEPQGGVGPAAGEAAGSESGTEPAGGKAATGETQTSDPGEPGVVLPPARRDR